MKPPALHRSVVFWLGAFGLVFLVLAGAVADRWFPEVVELRDEAELCDYVRHHGMQASLWEGTFYCGDKDGWSYFRHKLKALQDVELRVPAEAWRESERMAYSWSSKNWRGWGKLDVHREELRREEEKAREDNRKAGARGR